MNVKGSVWWIYFLQYFSGEALVLFVQVFVWWRTVLLVMKLLHCLHRALCNKFMFLNMLVVGLFNCLYKVCAGDYCFVSGDDILFYVQGFVQWITVLQSGCGDDLVLSV